MARPDVRPGRGAPENRTPDRFNLPVREADGDWLDARDEVDGAAPPLRTTVTVEHPKTIISRNQSPDIGFDRSINAYRGLRAWLHLLLRAADPRLSRSVVRASISRSKLFAKPDAAKLLRAELGKRGYEVRPIAMGTNTDPYQPIEGKWRITRAIARGAGRDEASGDDHHQVGPGTGGPRSARARWRRTISSASPSRSPRSTPEIARTLEPRAPGAAQAPRRGEGAARGRHPRLGVDRAGRAGDHRP